MEWLLTVAKSTDRAVVQQELAELGGSLQSGLPPVPQNDGTEILYAVGPVDLYAAAAQGRLPSVLHVHPSSAPEPY
jgi:hypothetical protein